MAFNITSLGQKGRNFARGEPPPRGSVEYAGVGDMFDPGPAPRPVAPPAPAPATPPPPASPVGRLVVAGLACAGAAYAASLLLRRRGEPARPRVGVPDAYPEEN